MLLLFAVPSSAFPIYPPTYWPLLLGWHNVPSYTSLPFPSLHSSGSGVSVSNTYACSAGYPGSPNTDAIVHQSADVAYLIRVSCTLTASKFSLTYLRVGCAISSARLRHLRDLYRWRYDVAQLPVCVLDIDGIWIFDGR